MTATTRSAPKPLQTAAGCNEAIGRMGEVQRALAKIATRLDAKIAGFKAEAEEAAQPLLAEMQTLGVLVRGYCEAHRDELLAGGGKTASFPAGSVAWKQNPAKVETLLPLEQILAALRKARLSRFIRVKEELDRQAVLKEPAAVAKIAGLRVPSAEELGEKFQVQPEGSKLAEVVCTPAPQD